MESIADLSRSTRPEPALLTPSSSSSPALSHVPTLPSYLPSPPRPAVSPSGLNSSLICNQSSLASRRSSHTCRFDPRVVMWVDSMAGSAPSYQDELSSLCRPEKVGGLGAKIKPNATASLSADPVDRKLQRKLNAIKKKSAQNLRKTSPVEENGLDDDDEDEEPESRVKAFTKRRAKLASQTQRSVKKIK